MRFPATELKQGHFPKHSIANFHIWLSADTKVYSRLPSPTALQAADDGDKVVTPCVSPPPPVPGDGHSTLPATGFSATGVVQCCWWYVSHRPHVSWERQSVTNSLVTKQPRMKLKLVAHWERQPLVSRITLLKQQGRHSQFLLIVCDQWSLKTLKPINVLANRVSGLIWCVTQYVRTI